jgi:hypothetical protein
VPQEPRVKPLENCLNGITNALSFIGNYGRRFGSKHADLGNIEISKVLIYFRSTKSKRKQNGLSLLTPMNTQNVTSCIK